MLAAKQFGEKPFEAVMSQEVTDGMYVTLYGTNYLVSRKVINPEGWSIVLMAPTDRILIYQVSWCDCDTIDMHFYNSTAHNHL